MSGIHTGYDCHDQARFQCRDVLLIRSDNEGSFSDILKDELKGMVITLEESASDTLAQNGHAERKGNMLAINAKALRIGANLPHYM